MSITTGKVPSEHVPAPPSYSHSIIVTNPSRRLVVSGQVGQTTGDNGVPMIPEDYEKQVAVVYKNLSGILSANGMGWMDVIKTSVFIVAGKTPEETQNRIVGFRRVRDTVVTPVFEGAVGRGPPASTLLVVSALADPRFLVEVEMEAIQ